MADTMVIGRTTQFGVETTPGTAPAAGATKQITDLTVTIDPAYTVTEVRGTGRRFDASVNPDGQERITGKLGGGLGYNSCVYPASMIWGAASMSVPAGGVNSHQWQWIPALTGSIAPKTFDVEMGDANDAEQVLYTLLTDFGIDLTRAATTPSGNLLGRALTKAAAGGSFTGMTSAGVTAIPILPVLPVQWAVYMDDLSANIGNTALHRCFHSAINYASAYTPFFALDPTVSSYAGVADNAAVQTTALLELMKDSTGEGLWTKARAGQKKYIRIQAKSNQYVDNLFQLNGQTAYTSGSVGLTYKGQAASFAYNALGSAIQSALTALSTVGAGNMVVTPSATAFNTNTTFTITMSGTLANDPSLITVTTQPTGGVVVVTAVQIPYSITVDYCGSIKLPGPQADNQGLRVRQWDFIVTEDPSWSSGQGMVVTVVNGIAAL